MVALPYPSPRRSSGGGSASSGFVRERALLIDTVNTRNFVSYLTSTTVSVEDIIDIAQAVEPGISAAQLRAHWMVCGSGGSGASGPGTGSGDDAVVWGGLPSHPIFHEINLSDIDDTLPITITVGAAVTGTLSSDGTDGNPSSVDFTTTSGDAYNIASQGGFGGKLSEIDYRVALLSAREYGLTLSDPTISHDVLGRVGDSPYDPGAGAPFKSGTVDNRYGGVANSARPDLSYFTADAHFEGLGGGGFSTADTESFESRDGVTPGGGGGAGDSAESLAGGSGGAGEVRLMLTVREIV